MKQSTRLTSSTILKCLWLKDGFGCQILFDFLGGIVAEEQCVGVAHGDLGDAHTVHASHLARAGRRFVNLTRTLEVLTIFNAKKM